MRGFKFKLARLARVRIVQEEIARGHWQNAEALAREALAQEQSARESVSTATVELALAQANVSLDPTRILQARGAIKGMERMVIALHQRTEVNQQEAARLRQPWQVVRTEVEGLKRLEEKAKTAFRIEREREEAKENDEVAMERASRKDFPLTRGGE